MDKGNIQNYILTAIAGGENFWELLRHSPFPLHKLIGELNLLYLDGRISSHAGVLKLKNTSSMPSRRESLKYLRDLHFDPALAASSKSTLNGSFKKLLKNFKKVSRKRPAPSLSFLQGYMTDEDVIKRVAFMHAMGDIDGKRIALIGDDDLLSVALALTHMPSEITVFDIDARLGKFLRMINESIGTRIRFVKYNVSHQIPIKFLHNYDVSSSEPLESPTGLRAFLVRGAELLSTGGVGYFGLTTLEASPRKWLHAERLLYSKHCAITDVMRGFSSYPFTDYAGMGYEKFAKRLKFPVGKNPGVNWYRSSLVRFKKLSASPETKAKLNVAPFDRDEELTYPTK